MAIAAAVSDYVSVEKNGDLASGDGGIIAQSKAVAIASIDQQADQENSASQSASLESGTITEEQSVEQTNRNEQEGLAVATAESDYVSVNNYGDVLNANSDGIDAESTAVAVATVTQEANQTNSASQNGTTTAAPSTVSLSQSLNQANFNEQEGIAIAVASADDVKVTSQGFVDPPGDGIHAESSAVAVAAVDQDATQSNIGFAAIECPPTGCSQTEINLKARQQNQSDQDGLAVAVATSGEVTVQQHGVVSAAEDGIDAELNAVAVATVQQEVSHTSPDAEPLALAPERNRFSGKRAGSCGDCGCALR